MSVLDTLPAWLSGKRFFGAIAALYICVATGMAWRMLGNPVVGADDANIFFVYARNFIHGHGIVYNVGGEHVEGFSSVLYFLICSIGFVFSSTPEAVLFLLNVFFAMLTSLCVVNTISEIADHLQLSTDSKFLFVVAYFLWLFFNPCYFAWNTVSLMDTALYSLLVTAGYALLAHLILAGSHAPQRHARQLGALIVLTILVRPEGIVWAALLFSGFAWIGWRRASSTAENLRQLRLPLTSLLVTPVALTLFRLAYFGYPLPNTYYAKISASWSATLTDGWGYFLSFVGFYGIFLLLPLCATVAWIAYGVLTQKLRTMLFSLACLTAAFSLTGLLIPVLEGGDHFNAFRMYQPVYPILFLSMMLPPLLLPGLSRRFLQPSYAFFLILLIVLTRYDAWSTFEDSNRPGQPIADMRMRMLAEFSIATNERENGARLHQLLRKDLPTIGFGSAGGIAYGYEGTVFDLMGLNNVRMAHADAIKTGPKGHQSFNKDVFYQLAPDMLMPRAAPAGFPVNLAAVQRYYTDPGSWDNQIFKGLFNDDRFRSTYTFALLTDMSQPGYVCYGYFSKAYLLRLSTNKDIRLSYLS